MAGNYEVLYGKQDKAEEVLHTAATSLRNNRVEDGHGRESFTGELCYGEDCPGLGRGSGV